ncbi:phytoene desaturase family protein [Paraburkholderia caribensis]|uniref:phytoene desaturase family protein n=1 Tax=Paraburkholderia caribensis TaxID=75105 RepID=UPI00078BB8BF|nr:NAD(P)/FAD-dependent oxidoreductase [Paraburkholderia caribensis]AMV48394.1 hypothetical protein ATN79_47955 [Paraburkholderia caribensis]
MSDQGDILSNYDVIVVGAGTNGLSLAANISREGYRVLIVESESRVGGQAVSEEALLPGFLIHKHANYLSYTDIICDQPYTSCKSFNTPSILPIAQHGICFRDGRPPVIVYRKDHSRRTFESLSYYSVRDARTYERCKKLADTLTSALSGLYFSVPCATSWTRYFAIVAKKYTHVLDTSNLGMRSARAVIDELFGSDEIRTLMYLTTTEFSVDLEESGGAVSFLGYVLWLLGRRKIPRGGMGSVPRALAASSRESGATIRLNSKVRRIVTQEGAVKGVMLDDGTFVGAKMVASSISYDVTLRMLDEQTWQASDLTSMLRYQGAEASLVGSYAACLGEAPRYKSAAFNGDINQCAQTFIGLDNTAEVLERELDLRAGRLPLPSGAVRVNSLWDESQAPNGAHVAGADCAFPARLDESDRIQVEQAYPEAFASMWASYAPDVMDQIKAQRLFLCGATSRKLVLREGAAQYRGPARGLYLCGSSTYPGGGVHGACGINAFQTMRSDITSFASRTR